MKDKLLQIVEHYGIQHQAKKLIEEASELLEAIVEYETCMTAEYDIPLTEIVKRKEHIKEEYADINVVLSQIGLFYEILSSEVLEIGEQKVNRQIGRMKNESIN